MDLSEKGPADADSLTAAEPDTVVVPVTDVLDLHSFPPKEIGDLVAEYLAEAQRLGIRELRIIHGRGIGAQRRQVRAILTRHRKVRDFADAPSGAGGWGATVVHLQDDSPD